MREDTVSKSIDTEQKLDDTVKSGSGVLMLFYSSWCPYCMRFLPVFEKHAQGKENFRRVMIDDMERCEDTYSINVVPTVLFFKNGEIVQRLDGVPGKGLNEKQLADMITSCGC
jgi:thioredoxin 1